MSQSHMQDDIRYAALVAALLAEPGVTDPASDEPSARGFGSRGLKVKGKLFVSFTQGRLLLKLPQARAAALIAAGVGLPFATGSGRVMREWVTAGAEASDEWLALAREALAFVSASAGGGH
jgi:hypothetical protein